jgi:hypothetical protein
MDKNTKKEFKKDARQFEFTVFLNDNIIVQRFFNVNGYNNKSINSLNFKEVIDENQEIIQNHMKNKSLDFLNDNSRYFYENSSFERNDSKDFMKIIVKMNDKTIAFREWDATIYPVRVRYTVNIREHIYGMITAIQKCLSESSDKLETTYLGYDLRVRK